MKINCERFVSSTSIECRHPNKTSKRHYLVFESIAKKAGEMKQYKPLKKFITLIEYT
jgi:hypothetical protein